MATIEIKGDIIGNDDKWIYDWFGMEATCPNDVKEAIQAAGEEELEVLINSGGGSVMAGQEMYSALKERGNVRIKVQSLAGSAAGVIAMAGKNAISPVAMVMIHNVSIQGASGDYRDMQKNAEILQQMNAALAEAYTTKSGMALEEVLKLMDRETWLTARQCLEYGFVDEIMEETKNSLYTNSCRGLWLTDEIRRRAEKERTQAEAARQKKELLSDLDFYGV